MNRGLCSLRKAVNWFSYPTILHYFNKDDPNVCNIFIGANSHLKNKPIVIADSLPPSLKWNVMTCENLDL